MNENERDVPMDRTMSQDVQAGEQSPAQIEREIERTRERMTSNIDALGDKLRPDNLKRQAKDAIAEKAQDVVSNVGDQARQTGSRVVEFITQNPLPVAAVTLGAIWLVTLRTRGRSEVSGDRMARFAYTGPERREPNGRPSLGRRLADRAGSLKHKVAGAAAEAGERASELKERVAGSAAHASERLGERAHELGDEARGQVSRAKGGFERMIEENPLAVALGATVIGFALGMLLPETDRERDLMGPARDRIADRVETSVSRVTEAAKDAGRDLRDVVREEVETRGPEVTSVLKDAALTVKDQVKESAARVAEEAKQEVKRGGSDSA